MTISKYSAKQNSKSIQTGDTNQLDKTHFERWLKAQKDDREPWQAPFFEAYYRVQGPLNVKYIGSRLNLQLCLFITRFDNLTEYKFSSAVKCKAIVKDIQAISNIYVAKHRKQFVITARLLSVDYQDFYTYRVPELQDLPKSEVVCYKPDAGDEFQMFYIPGDPNLDFQGIISHWFSNNWSIPCFTPPADRHTGFLISHDDQHQLVFEVKDPIDPKELLALLDSTAHPRSIEFCHEIVPVITKLDGEIVGNFKSQSFHLNLAYFGHHISFQQTPTDKNNDGLSFATLVGQVKGCAKERLLAQTHHFLYPELEHYAKLPSSKHPINPTTFFAPDSLVQFCLNHELHFGFIEFILGPKTPKKGVFPFALN